ncbi:MAG: hypothetical protein JO285_13135, partial [Kutzneria sp.]|nr:hypothetical protein [Kutzneria sp.]
LGGRRISEKKQRILRLEKGHLIVGQDTDGLTRAFSAGLDRLVKLDKDDFVGKPELLWQHDQGAQTRLVGLQPVNGQIVPPEASQLVAADTTRIVGRVTSSRMSPTLGRSICLAQVEAALAGPDTEVTVLLPDGRRIPARVTEHLAHVDPHGARLHTAGTPGTFRQHPPPVARSPIRTAAHAVGGSPNAALTLADHSALAKVVVRAPHAKAMAASLGVPFGRAARAADGTLVIGAGPGEWLVLGPADSGDGLLKQLRRQAEEVGGFVSVVDLTHGRAMLRLTGDRAADVLASVCAIDLDSDFTPNGAALRTSVATLVTDLVRDDQQGVPSYLLHCERSSGQSLWDAVLDAGAEHGIEISGEPTPSPEE